MADGDKREEGEAGRSGQIEGRTKNGEGGVEGEVTEGEESTAEGTREETTAEGGRGRGEVVGGRRTGAEANDRDGEDNEGEGETTERGEDGLS